MSFPRILFVLSVTVLAFFPVGAQVPLSHWRALIVYTNTVDSSWHTNWYEDQFLRIFDEINDIYEESGLDIQAEIAGVIWDKTYSGSSSDPYYHRNNVLNASGGMEYYRDLLDEYSANFLILMHMDPQLTTYGGAAYFLNDVQTVGYAGFWTNNVNGWVWAHEAGHNYNATHCNGYRQTYDVYGNYTTTNAISGFHTVMAYRGANAFECSGQGQIGTGINPDWPTSTFTFSDPNLVWWHPTTFNSYYLGTSINNVVGIHNSNRSTIRNLLTVPADLHIAESMGLEQWDYADFLATNSVTIESGFKLHAGAKMNISVGGIALLKRSAPSQVHQVSDKRSFSRITDVHAGYNSNSGTLTYSYNLSGVAEVSVEITSVNGRRKFYQKSLRARGSTSDVIALPHLPNGYYFLNIRSGSDSKVARFVKI